MSESLLSKFIKDIEHGNIIVQDSGYDVISYIRKIKECYKKLLKVHPKEFPTIESKLNSIIPTTDVDDNGNNLTEPKNLFLYKEIVRCLRYEYVQAKVFPNIMRQIGIKTCVYCNAQYAIATKSGHVFYQLDHFYPKSRYPYLSANFFNLQPCCGSCNLHKLDNDEMTHGKYNVSMWREMDDEVDDLYSFEIDNASLATYQVNHNNMLSVNYTFEHLV